MPSNYEEPFDESVHVSELVMRHAEKKAEEVKNRIGNREWRIENKILCTKYDVPCTFILGVDTVGYINGKVLEKAKDRTEARDMIRELQGNTHEVYSGIALVDLQTNKKSVQHEITKVTFNSMGDDEIEWYLDQNEWVDKSASYGIQGAMSRFVKKVEGDFFNIVGLPLSKLREMLVDFES